MLHMVFGISQGFLRDFLKHGSDFSGISQGFFRTFGISQGFLRDFSGISQKIRKIFTAKPGPRAPRVLDVSEGPRTDWEV